MTAADSNPTSLSRLLYVSDITTADLAAVVQICARSRPWNSEQGITGLLIFDGEHFSQYIEGPPAGIEDLFGRLQRDPRHTNMTVLDFGGAGTKRAFPSWQLAYAAGDKTLGLDGLRRLRGGTAIERFIRLAEVLRIEL